MKGILSHQVTRLQSFQGLLMLQPTLRHLRMHRRNLLLSQPQRLVSQRRRKLLKLKLLQQRSLKHLLHKALQLSHSFLLRKEKDEWVIVIFYCYSFLNYVYQFFYLMSSFIFKVPMTRLRKRVAQRLKDSQNTFAMLTTFNEVDM